MSHSWRINCINGRWRHRLDWSNWDDVTKGGGKVAVVGCYVCKEVVEDFTTSSYRLTGGGPVVGRVCVDCAQKPTAEEQAALEQYQEE